MSDIDIIITLLSIVYIFFATRNNAVCFVFGLLASAIWAYHDFVNLNLKFDGFLQIFYVVMSVWGLYNWKYSVKGQEDLPITHMTQKDHTVTIISGVFMGVGIAWLTKNVLDTAYPYLDAVTTALAVVTTVMLVQRKLENWLYWIIIAFGLCLYFYASRCSIACRNYGILCNSCCIWICGMEANNEKGSY